MPDNAFARARKTHQAGLEAIGEGRYREAMDLLSRAVAIRPCAKYHANLAVALERVAVDLENGNRRRELLEEAVTESLEAIRLRPSFQDARANLGLILSALGRHAEAVVQLERAASLAPRSAEAAWCYACALTTSEQWGDAAHWFERAWKLRPDMPAAERNIVASLSAAGRNAEALHVLHASLSRVPGNALAWSDTGCILRKLGRNDTALICYERAMALDPGLTTAHWGRSLCLLALGRSADGWDAYDAGLATGDRQPQRPFRMPVWDGRDPAGKTLLVWMEQGLGDQIAFAGMLPDLERAGARIVVECEHRLVGLFQRSFPGIEVVPQTLPPHPRTLEPDITLQIPAGSLPCRYRARLQDFPERRGYLLPDPPRLNEWRDRLVDLGPSHRIGVSWRSLKPDGARAMDCMSLNQWGPILSLPGVHWINLQCGWREDEMAEVGDRFDCRLHTWQDLDLTNDLDGLAALIANLDLVVTAFTVVAQLAGALGVPCWVLTHHGNLSWWGLGTDYCPWHSSIRFFFRNAMDPWDAAIGDLGACLRSRYAV